MVEIKALYEGDLRCSLTHGPSGKIITTDAPADNQGKAETFSPTDLVAAALASCILTVMGIVARRRGLDMTGTSVVVWKEMVNDPVRRIGELKVTVTFSKPISETDRTILERTAHTCPVHQSLHPSIKAPIEFVYV
jgi:putative redox protein